MPLAQRLLLRVARLTPPPSDPTADCLFYVAKCMQGAKGRGIVAVGRMRPRAAVAEGDECPNIETIASDTPNWFLNGGVAASLPNCHGWATGAMVGIGLSRVCEAGSWIEITRDPK